MGAIILRKNIGQDTEIKHLEVEKQTNIRTKYSKKLCKSFRSLDINSLNCELEFKSDVGRKQKITDLEVVAVS